MEEELTWRLRPSEQTIRLRSHEHFMDSGCDSDPDLNLTEHFTNIVYDNSGGSTPVQLTDPDLLDCPICAHPLSSEIYQCENGHIACSSCCVMVNEKCPSCSSPNGFNRCRIMERLVESNIVECKNKRVGCKERLVYHKKSEHESTCPYTLFLCPLPTCTFASFSKNLYKHFSRRHSTSATSFTFGEIFDLEANRNQRHVMLQERNEGVIFILNHEIKARVRLINIDCMGPNAFKNAFVYQITITCMDACLSYKSIPEVCSTWKEHTPNVRYFAIPSCFSDSRIKVCIKKGSLV